MKKCIWCLETDEKVSFKKIAHTVPQNLGGKNICSNVCDNCNAYFGNYNDKLPPIETILKETFNISRAKFLSIDNQIGKNKAMPKFSSIYFNANFEKGTLSLKPAYKLTPNFQQNILRQLKKGLYKIYLEETERQEGSAHHEKYNFIRDFCRYNIGDYPIIYFERLHGIVMMSKEWPKTPELFLDKESQFLYLVQEPGFFEFEFLGHVFGIAITKNWPKYFENYIIKTKEAKIGIFKQFRIVKNFNEIDFTLSVLNN